LQRSVLIPANVRALGSKQLDALQEITGDVNNVLREIGNAPTTGAFASHAGYTIVVGATNQGAGAVNGFNFKASRVARTSVETRGPNVVTPFFIAL